MFNRMEVETPKQTDIIPLSAFLVQQNQPDHSSLPSSSNSMIVSHEDKHADDDLDANDKWQSKHFSYCQHHNVSWPVEKKPTFKGSDAFWKLSERQQELWLRGLAVNTPL